MDKVYARIFWENSPSTKTALGAANLNRTDYAINEIDNRVIQHDTQKADKSEILNLVSAWTMDEKTGIITVTKVNGEKLIFDLNIEKIPVGFSLSPDGILTMTTADGTKFTANIGAMIPVLEFESTDTIAVSYTGTGVNKTYRLEVKNGSITEEKLRPDYLADIKTKTATASAAATAAADSAKSAQDSAANAEESEANASTSALTAQGHALAAGESESNAKRSEEAAAQSASDASASESAAKESEGAAAQSETNSAKSEENAAKSEQSASDKAGEATDSATLSKSWAVGGTETREGEDSDNSEFYSKESKKHREKAEKFAEYAAGAVEQINKKLRFAEFGIDGSGNLIYTDNSPYQFRVDDSGMLNWRVV